MRLLVIGAGAIGTRHLDTALRLGWTTGVVRRPGSGSSDRLSRATQVFVDDLPGAVSAFRPSAAIVATPTALHLDAARHLLALGVPTLIEKPLSADVVSAERFAATHAHAPAGVACNLRFWTPLVRMREALGSVGRILSVRVQAGQHLAQWRPGVDHRSSYSARPELGGGVILDLIHELDYLVWTFGMPASVLAAVRGTGSLGIETEDLVAAVLRWGNGSLGEVHLDYLRHQSRRAFEIIGTSGTMAYDTDQQRLEYWQPGGGVDLLHEGQAGELGETYAAQLHNLRAVTEGKEAFRTTLEEGVRALRVAEAIRAAAASHAAVAL